MRRVIRSIVGIFLVVATLTACDSGGGAPNTASNGSPPTPTTPPPPGGSGGSGGSGGESASLNTTRFRTLTVSVTPPDSGTVSDNFENYGSAVQQCTTCTERYQVGTRVVLTARAAPGFRFDRWQEPVCEGSASATCALVIEQPTQITAEFRQ